MLSCVGDVDVMHHSSTQLAIPAGYSPPTQLPGEFGGQVEVYEIVDSEFPGYVYMVSSYLLTESVHDDKYKAVQCKHKVFTIDLGSPDGWSVHGPAFSHEYSLPSIKIGKLVESSYSFDIVFCMRCLIWPPQAADWPMRQRNYDWPDSATVDHVVSNGCDVVNVAHRLCRHDEWMRKRQWRLSFSRAEIVLLNSWMLVQQIVYHMLRIFMKTEKLTDSTATNIGSGTLSNYHIKTLMLWACELKPRSWWTDDLNLVRICVKLLHALAVWLTDEQCQHYFISNCNLYDQLEHSQFFKVTASKLMSITRAWFCKWCIDNYIFKTVQLHPSRKSHDIGYIQDVVSVIAKLQHVQLSFLYSHYSDFIIITFVSRNSLTLESCLHCLDLLEKTNQVLLVYFTAVMFLHVAYKTTQSLLTDEMLDVLATTACLQLNDVHVRHCLNARHSSVLSLSQAAILMKVIANSSYSTVHLIEIELAKAYLHRALRCTDTEKKYTRCVTNIYLVVFYYTTGQYQTAIDHCEMVTRLQDHSECSSHVVQGEILPRIDDQVDNILGLAVFYQYIRAAVLNKEQERRYISVFTTELFAHYLHVKLLSITKCHQLSQTAQTDEVQQYQTCLCNLPEVFVTDLMLFCFLSHTSYASSSDRLVMADRDETKSLILHQLDTCKLVELLQQSAVEHLTTCREFEALECGSFAMVVMPDFKALYAYKRGQYQECLQLSMHSICNIIAGIEYMKQAIIFFPEIIQLMDDDIVSLIGLVTMVDPLPNRKSPVIIIYQLSLSLYLMTQCQIKLRHSVTSLGRTLGYIQLARDKFEENSADQLVMKFAEQKLIYRTLAQ